ncbi:Glycine-rich RNA-binding protein 4, mitochondrial [Linum perenne]
MRKTLTSVAGKAYAAVHNATSPPGPNSKLFVAGLSWSVNEKSLQDAKFRLLITTCSTKCLTEFLLLNSSILCAILVVRIAYDKESGRSRGFGFVSFTKEEQAMIAKNAMDGKAFLGRPLSISFALERVRGGSPVVLPRLSNVTPHPSRE